MSGWLRSLWYDLGYVTCLPSFTFAFSMRFQGSQHLPKSGPALLVSNHQSFLDPVLIGVAASNRRLSFLARKTLFKSQFFAGLIRSFGAVPVNQEGMAKEGIQAVLELLGQGKCVLVFPEGERTPTGELLPLKPGITLMLKRVKVPVVPIGIAGAYDVLPRHRKTPIFSPLVLPARRRGAIAVTIGRPLLSQTLAALSREDALKEIGKAIAEQHDCAERLRRKI